MDASMRTRLLKAKTLATYTNHLPAQGKPLDMANRGQSAEILLLREVGQRTTACTDCP